MSTSGQGMVARRGRLARSAIALVGALAFCCGTACTSPEIAIGPEPAPARADAPVALQGDAEVPIPRPGNGVLPAGAADRILPAGSAPIVRLLEAGGEPRGDLSYALIKGAAQKMGMGMDMSVGIKSKGQTLPTTPMPHMTVTLDTNAAEKNAMGDFRIDSRLQSVTVDPNGAQQEQMARALRPQTDAMKGLGLAYWVNAKGQVRDVKLDIPAGVPPAAQQLMTGMSESFESMVIPLPQGAVGVGARWQVVTRVVRGGADLVQSTVYTLKSRSGSRVTLDFSVLQLAGNDTIHTAQMPAGMSAKLKRFSSGGSGTTRLDVQSVVPEGGTANIKTTMELSVQGETSPEESTVETTTGIQLSRP